MHSLEIDENLKLVWKDMDDHWWVRRESGLAQLCKIEYWERLWVVQEYLLAKSVDMWCGTDSVDPEKIKWLVYVAFKTPHLAELRHTTIAGKKSAKRTCRTALPQTTSRRLRYKNDVR